MAGAYLGVGEPDVVINVGVSGPGVVKKALDRAFAAKGEYLTITDAAEVIKQTAYKVTRVGEIIGNDVARALDLPFGVADLSLAPTPAVGDSVGEIFKSMGLSSIGAPGTTAVLAMLNDAVKKGGVFAFLFQVRAWAIRLSLADCWVKPLLFASQVATRRALSNWVDAFLRRFIR